MWTRLTSPNLMVRIAWAYATYVLLVLVSFAFGYFVLPRGAFINSPWTALGAIAASPESLLGELLATLAINVGIALVLGVGLNLQRVNGFPTGYVFVFSAGVISGLVAGTNSFAVQVISPYTVEGWIVALRIQHLELLGYTTIVASTISFGLSDYSSWLPWVAKERRIKSWRDIRITKIELFGLVAGMLLLVIAAYNETLLVM